jgi:hypothetical protein
MAMSSPTSAGPLRSPNVNTSSANPRRSPPSAVTYAAPRPADSLTVPPSPTWTPQLQIKPALTVRLAAMPTSNTFSTLSTDDSPCCSCMTDDGTPPSPDPSMIDDGSGAGPSTSLRILWRTSQALPAPTGELRLGAGCGIRLPCPPGFSPPHYGFTGFNFTNLGL